MGGAPQLQTLSKLNDIPAILTPALSCAVAAVSATSPKNPTLSCIFVNPRFISTEISPSTEADNIVLLIIKDKFASSFITAKSR